MRVLSVVGNRPQFIKSAPLSLALREAGIDEVVVHTGQHWDAELSQVFFDELGLIEPPRYRLDLRTADAAAMEQPLRDDGRPRAAGLGARLRRHELDGGRRARRRRRSRWRTSRPGSGASTSRCPRSETGSRSTAVAALLLCPDERSAAQLERRGRGGRRVVVGDVMADATRLFAPLARERSTALGRFGVEPGAYARRDGPPRGERDAAGAARAHRRRPAARRRAARLPGAPAHAGRARGAVESSCRLVPPLGYLDFAALVVAGACRRHRLRAACRRRPTGTGCRA